MNITDIICGLFISFVDARVGLEKISYMVDEDIRVVQICVRVFEPGIRCPIDFAFYLHFVTIAGSAGMLLI